MSVQKMRSAHALCHVNPCQALHSNDFLVEHWAAFLFVVGGDLFKERADRSRVQIDCWAPGFRLFFGSRIQLRFQCCCEEVNKIIAVASTVLYRPLAKINKASSRSVSDKWNAHFLSQVKSTYLWKNMSSIRCSSFCFGLMISNTVILVLSSIVF